MHGKKELKQIYEKLAKIKPTSLPELDPYLSLARKPVPKIIFRTWSSPSAETCGGRPYPYKAIKKTLATLKGEWEQKILYDADVQPWLDHYFGPESRITKAYNRINPAYGAACADLLRYLLIYVHGGLYLDMKSAAVKSLPEMPDDKDLMTCQHRFALFVQEHLVNGGEFQQWFLYGRPGSPVLKNVIEQVVYNIETFSEKTVALATEYHSKSIVLTTTGPIAFTMAVQRYINDVSINPVLNECLTYTYGYSKVGGKHYSKQSEPLILPPHSVA